MRNNFSTFVAFAILTLVLAAFPATAQEAQPGDACPVANRYIVSGAVENAGKVYHMTCQGGVWVLIYASDTDGNVGIGTATPATLLELKTATGSFPKLRFSAADVTLPNLSNSSSLDDVSATNTIGQIRSRGDNYGTEKGGLLVQGFTGSGVNNHYPLHLVGTHGGTAPTTAAVTISGQKWSGVNNRNFLTSTTPVLDVENLYDTAGSGSGALLFRIMGDGKVGIGTDAPGAKLHVNGGNVMVTGVDGTWVSFDMSAYSSTNWWDSPYFVLSRARGTQASPSHLLSGDILGSFSFRSRVVNSAGSQIDSFATQNHSASALGSDLRFSTTANGATSTSLRMVIANGGNVAIGNNASPSYLLHLSSDSAGKPNGGSWANSSDARIKKNISSIEGALEKITALRGVNFEWINPGEHGNAEGTQGGFIAQEIEKVFPEWVNEIPPTEKDAELVSGGEKIKSLTLPFEFDAYLVEAVKELSAQNKALLARIEALEAHLDE